MTDSEDVDARRLAEIGPAAGDDVDVEQLVEFHCVVSALLADPEVTGALLGIGVWLARATIIGGPAEIKTRIWHIARDVYGHGKPMFVEGFGFKETVENHHIWQVRDALRQDAPRYDPFKDNPSDRQGVCTAPRVRTEGICGRNAGTWGFLTDLDTGRRVAAGACRRHQEWFRRVDRENRQAVKEAGDYLPHPAANTGGALARHITGIDWPKLWTSLNPDWAPPPEGTPTRKPRLTVILTDEPGTEPGADDVEALPARRPTLSVIRGGWQ